MATDTPSDNNLASRSLVIAAVIAVLIVGAGAYALWPSDDGEAASEPLSPVEPSDIEDVTQALAAPTQLIGESVPAGFPETEEGAISAAVAWTSRLWRWPPDQLTDPSLKEILAPGSEGIFGLSDPEDGPAVLYYGLAVIAVGDVVEVDNGYSIELLATSTEVVPGQDRVVLGGQIAVVKVEWFSEVEDWRWVEVINGQADIEPPFTTRDFARFRWLEPASATAGGLVVP